MTIQQTFNPIIWSAMILAFLFVIMVTLLGILNVLNDIAASMKEHNASKTDDTTQ